MNKRKSVFILALFLFFGNILPSFAYKPDEGMWLPMFLSEVYPDMKKLGLELTPEQIYSVNKSSVKDAIVQLGNKGGGYFCSGSFISDKGLMITNHHCGYGSIQSVSSVEHNYLKNGFWAKSQEEEIYIPDLKIRILVRMEEITKKVLDENGEENTPEIEAIKEKAKNEGVSYEVEVKKMYAGTRYFLFVYQVFNDVRLVGTPPESIGKFGGDTDNWMYPRHTGDFSMFRVYANKNNEPAEYSPENVPYKPKHFLPVSIKGLKEKDFVMIIGFPGQTERYLTATELKFKINKLDPVLIKTFGRRLEIMKADMDKDEEIRLKLADTYASIANSHKYFIGLISDVKKKGVIKMHEERDARIKSWIEKNAKEEYGNLFEQIEELYKSVEDVLPKLYLINTTAFSSQAVDHAFWGFRMVRMKASLGDDPESYKSMLEEKKQELDEDYKDFVYETDKKVFAGLLELYYNEIGDKKPEWLSKILKKYKGKTLSESFMKYADYVYSKSIFTDKTRFKNFLDKFSVKKLEKDPLITYINTVIKDLQPVMMPYQMYQTKDKVLHKKYFTALQKAFPNKAVYPDANMTPRLTYGTVKGYHPFDAAYYYPFTTGQGIWEKYKPGDEEFDAPKELIEKIRNKDFGEYGENGKLIVNFLSNTDITGGNSGSGIMNGRGELVGLAFDGNWEGMAGDVKYLEPYNRTIGVDIRFCLFVIDKVYGAKNLVEEMKIIR